MISKEQFQQWSNDETTCYIRNLLVKEAQKHTNLTDSPAEKAVYGSLVYSLEDMGLHSAMSMATVRGIELFTDTDTLSEFIFGGEE